MRSPMQTHEILAAKYHSGWASDPVKAHALEQCLLINALHLELEGTVSATDRMRAGRVMADRLRRQIEQSRRDRRHVIAQVAAHIGAM